jgi:regulatory factor X
VCEETVNIIVRHLSFFSHTYLAIIILTDCGIRPATSSEAEWLQEYIHKSNNNAGQPSVNAARLAQEQSESSNRGEERSDEEDDEDSEGQASSGTSKRNSLALNNNEAKGSTGFSEELSDKTPTVATLLSQVQAAQRPATSFPPEATIRRHPQQEPVHGTQPQSQSPTGNSNGPVSYPASQQPISVRHFPHFPSIEEAVGSNSTSPHGHAAREVWGWFLDHLDSLLESVRLFRFDQFEMHLRTFWSSLGGNHREVVHAPAIAGLMAKADAIVYDVRVPLYQLLLSYVFKGTPGGSTISDALTDTHSVAGEFATTG